MWGFFSHFLTLKFFWDVLKLNKQRSPKAKNWWNSFANFAVFKKDIPHGSELRSLSAPKISKRFSKPSISTAEPAKRSTYTLSYWLLFFGNQQQAEQKYNTSGEFGANRKWDWKTSRKQRPVIQRHKHTGTRKQIPHFSLIPYIPRGTGSKELFSLKS